MSRAEYEDQQLPAILRLLDEHPEMGNFEIADAVGLTVATRDAPVGRTRTVLKAVKRLWTLTPK